MNSLIRLAVAVTLAACCLPAGALRCQDTKPDDALRKERDKLEGTWSVKSIQQGGEALPSDVARALKIVIQGDRITTFNGDKKVAEVTYQFDPTRDPKTMEWRADGKVVARGKYTLDGNRLLMNLAGDDKVSNVLELERAAAPLAGDAPAKSGPAAWQSNPGELQKLVAAEAAKTDKFTQFDALDKQFKDKKVRWNVTFQGHQRQQGKLRILFKSLPPTFLFYAPAADEMFWENAKAGTEVIIEAKIANTFLGELNGVKTAIISFADLSRGKPADGEKSGDGPSREKLVAELVARGDAAAAKDKENSHWAYTFAALYAPKDAKVRDKLKAIGPTSFSATNAEIGQMQSAIFLFASDDFKTWPEPTPATDLIELRMLLDAKLVGQLRHSYFAANQSGVGALVFVGRPDRTIKDVREAYGKPSSEKEYKDGGTLLTYGRVRIAGDKAGKVAGVFFRPFGLSD